MPSGAIEQQDGVGALSDIARDLVEVKLHHVGVRVGQRQSRSNTASRTDRAEPIGVVVALVGGLSGPRSTPGPLADKAVLLANSGPHPELVEGHLGTRFRLAPSRRCLRDEPSARAGSFFKPLDDPLVLGRMTRPGADVREAKLLQELSDIARMKVDAEPLAMTRLRSTRRHRTMPSFSRSGPASTIFAN